MSSGQFFVYGFCEIAAKYRILKKTSSKRNPCTDSALLDFYFL
jgi:hypothetical protein